MPKITSYNIKLEIGWDDGSKETIDASEVYSKEIEWYLDGLEQEREEENDWEESEEEDEE